MFFVMPLTPVFPVFLLYILAAVLPAVYLLRYIYRQDSVEPEPFGLLLKLLLFGVAAALLSSVLEGVGESLLNSFVYPADPRYTTLLAFLVVATVEEGAKLFFLKRGTWRHPAFDYRFDAIVYAAFVSLGFAAFENIYYVFGYGLSVAIPRALLSVPGHLSFAVFMGVHYGRARLHANRGHTFHARVNLWLAYLVPVFLHGFYDACAMSSTTRSTVIFFAFVIILFLWARYTVRRESDTDRRIVSRW